MKMVVFDYIKPLPPNVSYNESTKCFSVFFHVVRSPCMWVIGGVSNWFTVSGWYACCQGVDTWHAWTLETEEIKFGQIIHSLTPCSWIASGNFLIISSFNLHFSKVSLPWSEKKSKKRTLTYHLHTSIHSGTKKKEFIQFIFNLAISRHIPNCQKLMLQFGLYLPSMLC